MSGVEDAVTAGVGGTVVTGRALPALLFMGAGTNAIDTFSALTEIPNRISADPDGVMEYVMHSIVVTGLYAFAGAAIVRNGYPIAGWMVASVYMYLLYRRALNRHTVGTVSDG